MELELQIAVLEAIRDHYASVGSIPTLNAGVTAALETLRRLNAPALERILAAARRKVSADDAVFLAGTGKIARDFDTLREEQQAAEHELAQAVHATTGEHMPATGTVADISDAELVRRAVRNAKPRQAGRAPRWVAVMDTFGLGSTYATQLCRKYGLDPDEQSPYYIRCISCSP